MEVGGVPNKTYSATDREKQGLRSLRGGYPSNHLRQGRVAQLCRITTASRNRSAGLTAMLAVPTVKPESTTRCPQTSGSYTMSPEDCVHQRTVLVKSCCALSQCMTVVLLWRGGVNLHCLTPTLRMLRQIGASGRTVRRRRLQ